MQTLATSSTENTEAYPAFPDLETVGDHMLQPDDRAPAQGREDAGGGVWFTIAEAAAFIGGSVQTIYSWERRGHLTDPRHDVRGRRIYTQQQIAAAHRTTRRVAA
ncbi:MerR family DNA-binding transcriptional regulator [Streptomyces sp. NPDC046979]|uniref:MerR family DNA-binding transcriptional regulator n=1 Tax=Streptomyces sp. NPDC046979 TaxID=3154604 RepID=UPI0033DCB3D7